MNRKHIAYGILTLLLFAAPVLVAKLFPDAEHPRALIFSLGLFCGFAWWILTQIFYPIAVLRLMDALDHFLTKKGF